MKSRRQIHLQHKSLNECENGKDSVKLYVLSVWRDATRTNSRERMAEGVGACRPEIATRFNLKVKRIVCSGDD